MVDFFTVFFFVFTVIVTVVVIPLWLVLHFSARKRDARVLSEVDREDLSELSEVIGDMTERVETLESILDDQSPQWRRSTEQDR